MAIKSVAAYNMSVFKNLKIDMCSGVNILIGPNGSGKTHLLKAIYGDCLTSVNRESIPFTKCFRVTPHKPLHRDISEILSFALYDESGDVDNQRIIHNLSKEPFASNEDKANTIAIEYSIFYPFNPIKASYIPVKDMLTHNKGLVSMSNRYAGFPFDKTLLDSIEKANHWKLKEIPEFAKNIIPVLEKMIGGTVVLENDEFYIKKNNGRMVHFDVEAEGYKKIGLLWQLIMNENITPGSVLLWDEPEANINPSFISDLVWCLIELSRQGVQVIVSTHSYIFADYFEIHKKDNDKITYISLYFEGDHVNCEYADRFSVLQHNDIVETFDRMLDEIYANRIAKL